MSLILDALNRARDNVEPVPTLATNHPVEPVPVGGRQYVLWAALAVGLLLIAWLVWSRFVPDGSNPAESASPVAALTENIGSAASAVTTELKARADARWEAANPDAVQQAQPRQQASPVDDAPATESRAAPRPQSSQVTANAGTRAPVAVEPQPVAEPEPPELQRELKQGKPAQENSEVARLYRERTVPATPPSSRPASSAGASASADAGEELIDIEEALQRAQQEREEANLEEHPVPFLTSLSQQTKDDIPTIYYREHDYSSAPGQSTVTLNGKTLKVGGSPGAGIKVEEILPNSVVLSLRGTQFRLRALNSWVNL